jgi:hypothetical protein
MIMFYWASTFAFMLIPTWYLLSFLFFTREKYLISLGFFILGLFTNELIITLPILLLIYILDKKKLTHAIKITAPFFLLSLIYLGFRAVFAQLPKSADYALTTNIKEILINLRSYLFWVFNWPDGIQDQIRNGIFLDHAYVQHFVFFVGLLVFNTLLFLSTLIAAPILLIKNLTKKTPVLKIVAFGFGWFLITLSPVLVFKQHFYSYYLPIPLIGVLIAVLILSKELLKNSLFPKEIIWTVMSITAVVWAFSAYSSVQLSTLTHWAPHRAQLSLAYFTLLAARYPNISHNAVVVIPEKNSDEIKWALGEGRALQVIYNSSDIVTFFGNYPLTNFNATRPLVVIEK